MAKTLLLVTAWKAEVREGEPTVLYCGHDQVAARTAITAAPPEFLRIEQAQVHFSLKVTRPALVPSIPSVVSVPSTPAPNAALEAPSGDEGPVVELDQPPKKSKK